MRKTLQSLGLWLDKNATLVATLLIVITFLTGTVYAVYLGTSFSFYDEYEYYTIAKNIVHNRIYSLNGVTSTAWRPPVFPLFLAPFIFAHADVIMLRFVNIAVFCTAMALLFHLLKRESPLAGVLSVIGIMAYPVLFYTAGTLYPQTFAGVGILLVANLLFRESPPSPVTLMLVGLTLGLLALTVPSFAVIIPFVAVWVYYLSNTQKIYAALTIVLAASCVIAPWTIRNALTFHAFIPLSTNGGINLLLGNSAETDPEEGVNVDLSSYYTGLSHLKGEVEYDRYFKEEAWKYILENKWQTFTLYVKKFLNYFSYWNLFATKAEASSWRENMMMVTYGFIINITLLRLLFFRRYPLQKIEIFFISLYILSALATAVYFTRIRFRLPFDLGLIYINSRFLYLLWRDYVFQWSPDAKNA